MSRRWTSIIFVITLVLFGIQYLFIYHKNTLISHHSEIILQLNSTWSNLRQHRSDPKGAHYHPEIESNLKMSPSRELKPLPVSSGKRAVLFTMDSIGSCQTSTSFSLNLFLSHFSFLLIDESDSKKGGAAGLTTINLLSSFSAFTPRRTLDPSLLRARLQSSGNLLGSNSLRRAIQFY
jgi:hypothetical protein